jgi:hypothetical protein
MGPQTCSSKKAAENKVSNHSPVILLRAWLYPHPSFFDPEVQGSLSNSNKLTIQMQQFYKFITWHVSLNMFRAPPRPTSGAYNCINSLRFYLGTWWYQRCWSWSGRFWPAKVKNAVVSSWCWVWRRPKHVERNKRQVINLRNCCIWLVNLFELYDDAWTCQHQFVQIFGSRAHLHTMPSFR